MSTDSHADSTKRYNQRAFDRCGKKSNENLLKETIESIQLLLLLYLHWNMNDLYMMTSFCIIVHTSISQQSHSLSWSRRQRGDTLENSGKTLGWELRLGLTKYRWHFVFLDNLSSDFHTAELLICGQRAGGGVKSTIKIIAYNSLSPSFSSL